MTREEQIQEAKDKTFPTSKEGRSYESAWAAGGFEMGAHWADEHPINVWHTINEQPKIDEDVVLYDSCGNFVTEFYNGDVTWNNIVVFHKATMWAYVADVLPKGGEQ